MKCEYGCNQKALYQLKNKKWCCSKSFNSCEAIKQKNSLGLKKAYKDGKKNVDHFDGKRGWSKGKNIFNDDRIKPKTKENIFINSNKKFHNEVIKKYLIFYNLKDEKCETCGIIKWNEKKISLELHHIDGDNKNNTIENLQLLCPNCHSQTVNFRKSKTINKLKKIITDEEFITVLKKNKSIRKALIELGIAPYGGNYERAKKLLMSV